MKQKDRSLLQQYIHIMKAANKSNDGNRCMIAPHPDLKKKLKDELKNLKRDLGSSVLSNLIRPLGKTKLGFNDALLRPGSSFPLGMSARGIKKEAATRSPLQGAVRVIVVLVDFADKKLSLPKKHYQDLFFSEGVVETGSVREYFTEVTNGKVKIAGEVVGPYQLPKTKAAYAHGESGTGDALPNARTMAADAAKAANTAVDFSKYDNDHDGYVDAFVVVHAGSGAEETGKETDIWSHKWLLPQEYNADGTHVFAYLTVPEDCKLGVCAHELGHLLFGFPDLYDDDYTSEGIGEWCLMAGGSWNNGGDTPAHPCAWCKMQQNWVDTVTLSSNKKSVSVPDVKDSKTIYRLWKNGSSGNEYFLAENRTKRLFDQYLPGEGMLIYHIDDAIDSNSNEQHYKVALMQADGRKQLETGSNSGDAADTWPGAKKKKTFSGSSKPNSKSYGNIKTDVAIKNIKMKSGIITADMFVKPGAATAPAATRGKRNMR